MRRVYVREFFNGFSHLAAAFAGCVGLYILLDFAIRWGTELHFITFCIFGLSLVFVFMCSALYHLAYTGPSGTRVLKRLDHISIFLFVGGSYTPVCLIAFKDSFGLYLLLGVWTFVILGIIKKIFWISAPKWFSTLLYVVIGGVSVFTLPEMMRTFPPGGVFLVLAGGAMYVVGALVYYFEWPNPFPHKFGHHEIWHVFVIFGTLCHYLMVLNLVNLS